jgi:hypothetical protein
MKGDIKTPNIEENLYERIVFSVATLHLSNDDVPQSTEIVLQFGEGIENVEFRY